jgi:hypothetical protein
MSDPRGAQDNEKATSDLADTAEIIAPSAEFVPLEGVQDILFMMSHQAIAKASDGGDLYIRRSGGRRKSRRKQKYSVGGLPLDVHNRLPQTGWTAGSDREAIKKGNEWLNRYRNELAAS